MAEITSKTENRHENNRLRPDTRHSTCNLRCRLGFFSSGLFSSFFFLFSFSWQILLIITWLRANFMIYRRKREERKTNNKLSFCTRCFYDFCFMNSVNSLRQSHGQVCVCHACICIWVIFYCCNSCLAGNFVVHETYECVPNLSMDEKKRIFTTFIK